MTSDDESTGSRGRPRRCWTLESATEILPDVRRYTQRARSVYGPLHEQREARPPGSAERVEAEQAMRRCLSRWVREMEALGVVVRGLWRVEFTSESGAFPWQWPEQTLRSVRESEHDPVTVH
jgi:hypothetical protein